MKNRKNSLNKNVAISLLLVAAMLIGAIAVPVTFAAPAPVDDPVDEVYASTTANYNSADYSLDARDVIDDLTRDSTWGAWNSNKEYVLHDIDDAAKIVDIIKDNATFDGMHATTYIPEEYDLLIATPTQSVYICFPLDEVTVNTRGAGLVYKLPGEATLDIMDIYAMSRGVDLDSKCPLVMSDASGLIICDGEWNYAEVSTENLQRIAQLINQEYRYSREVDIYYPRGFDFVIFDTAYGQDIYVMASTNELLVIDYINPSYVCTVDPSVMEEIMSHYNGYEQPTIKLTAEIIENLKVMSKANPKLNVAGLDIALVERFIFEADQQAALEIVNILQANGHASDEYLQNALAAENYMDMSISLMLEIISICEDHIYMVDYSTYGYLVGQIQDYYQHCNHQAVVEKAYHAMCVAVWMKSMNHVYWLE